MTASAINELKVLKNNEVALATKKELLIGKLVELEIKLTDEVYLKDINVRILRNANIETKQR